MLGNRVKETTATTGTISFVTAGAVEGFRTFNNSFGLDRRFTYWAINGPEWETGIGYMSDTTTLVRETVLENSAGTFVAIGFTTAPSLFCGTANSDFVSGLGPLPSNTLVSSEHITGGLTDAALGAETIYYMPFLYTIPNDFDALIYLNDSVGTATKVRLGLYENNKSRPGKIIVQTGDMTPVAESFIEASIAAQSIPPGWYFIAMLIDGTLQSRRPFSTSTLGILGVREGQSFATHYGFCTEVVASGWTALPDVAGSVTLINADGPKILVRTV